MALSQEQHDELCTSYAALALYDGEAEMTADQIKKLIEATGNEVEAYWPVLFASLLQNRIEDLILTVGGGGGGGPAAAGAAAAAGGDAAAADAAPAKKEEEEEEEVDMAGGMDMFGGGEGGGGDY